MKLLLLVFLPLLIKQFPPTSPSSYLLGPNTLISTLSSSICNNVCNITCYSQVHSNSKPEMNIILDPITCSNTVTMHMYLVPAAGDCAQKLHNYVLQFHNCVASYKYCIT